MRPALERILLFGSLLPSTTPLRRVTVSRWPITTILRSLVRPERTAERETLGQLIALFKWIERA